jgi:ParB-like nuclease domain
VRIRSEGMTLPLAALVRPADIDVRKTQPHVIALSKSIARDGLIHALLVSADRVDLKYPVVCGGDRFAALELAGIRTARVSIVDEATATEVARLVRTENVLRRDVPDRAKQLAELFDERVAEVLAEQQVLASPHPTARVEAGKMALTPAYAPPNPPPARPVDATGQMSDGIATRRNGTTFAASPVGIAKAQVLGEMSAATGKSPEAIRKAVERVKAESKPAAPTSDADRSLDGLRRAAKLAAMYSAELAAAFPGRLDCRDLADICRAALEKADGLKLPKVAAVQAEIGGAA